MFPSLELTAELAAGSYDPESPFWFKNSTDHTPYGFTYELTGSQYGTDVTGRLLKVTHVNPGTMLGALPPVQLVFHIYIQPKSSYSPQGNVLVFRWGDPADSLKQFPLEVSYVPDPTYHGVVYSALSVKDGHVFADGVQLSP